MDPTTALTLIHDRHDQMRREAALERLDAQRRHRRRRPIQLTLEVVRRRLLPAA
jgi:hypothetical protein